MTFPHHEPEFRLTHVASGLSVRLRTRTHHPRPADMAVARRWLSSIVRHAEGAGRGVREPDAAADASPIGQQIRSYHFVFGVGVRDRRTGHREADSEAVVRDGKIDGFIRANVMGGIGR